MNDTEILVTGELCAALLASSDFKTIIGQYELTIAADILATKAHEKSRREELYGTLWGARGLLEYMQLNANAAAKIKAPTNPNPEEGVTDYHVEETYDDEGFPTEDEA